MNTRAKLENIGLLLFILADNNPDPIAAENNIASLLLILSTSSADFVAEFGPELHLQIYGQARHGI